MNSDCYPYEASLLIIFFKTHLRRLCPEMEIFVGMRKSHIIYILKNKLDVVDTLAPLYLRNYLLYHRRMERYNIYICADFKYDMWCH